MKLTPFEELVRGSGDAKEVELRLIDDFPRTNILPSEKAKAYQMKMAALAKQGKRTDLTAQESSRQKGGKWKRETAEKIGEEAGYSGRQVQRFLRLNHLIPELLERVDDGTLSFSVGVELSYLKQGQQKLLLQYLEAHPTRISAGFAKRLRKMPWDVPLSDEQLREVFGRETQKPKKQQKEQADMMSGDDFRKYFPEDYTAAQRRETIICLLKKWKEGGYIL